MFTRPKDSSWVKQSFMLSKGAVDDKDMQRRLMTTAAFKFTDTTIGGNFAINAPPQFTRYADIKMGGSSQQRYGETLGGNKGPSAAHTSSLHENHGMGRYYSEAIDDNAQHVIMRFGVPEFNALTTFFGNFYDADASALARTGRSEGAFYSAGRAAGFLLALPFAPLILGGRIVKFFSAEPPSKFYYLKPAMPLYWNAVNTMVNGIAVNMGVVPRVLSNEQKEVYKNPSDYPSGYGAESVLAYHNLLPDIITAPHKDENGRMVGGGAIDVYALSTRAQRLGNAYNAMLIKAMDKGNGSKETIRTNMQEFLRRILSGQLKTPSSRGIDEYVKSYAGLAQNIPATNTKDKETGVATLPTTTNADNQAVASRKHYDGIVTSSVNAVKGAIGSIGTAVSTSSWAEYFEGERRDGSSFVTFKVDYSGTASESFSNSTKESEISQKMNSMSNAARSTRFNFAEGNIGGGVIAGLAEGAIGAVKGLLNGALDSVGFSGLAALGGSAFVDIPKTWDASTANLPRADYTIELRSPYGNKLSRLTNLYIPLSMLLAGALPLSAGKHAYTSPFICEAYCRGRVAIRLGMIDSITITRGTGNLGWTPDGEPLGIDVSFSVVDLSSIMHMPIAASFSTKDALLAQATQVVVGGIAGADAAEAATGAVIGSSYDDDNSYTDYLAVLGSLSWTDMIYTPNKWALNLTKQLGAFESWKSSSHFASYIMGTLPGRMINALALGSDRPD